MTEGFLWNQQELFLTVLNRTLHLGMKNTGILLLLTMQSFNNPRYINKYILQFKTRDDPSLDWTSNPFTWLLLIRLLRHLFQGHVKLHCTWRRQPSAKNKFYIATLDPLTFPVPSHQSFHQNNFYVQYKRHNLSGLRQRLGLTNCSC